jgi:hypothetical protein
MRGSAAALRVCLPACLYALLMLPSLPVRELCLWRSESGQRLGCLEGRQGRFGTGCVVCMVHGHMCVGLRHGYNDHGECLRSPSVFREGKDDGIDTGYVPYSTAERR